MTNKLLSYDRNSLISNCFPKLLKYLWVNFIKICDFTKNFLISENFSYPNFLYPKPTAKGYNPGIRDPESRNSGIPVNFTSAIKSRICFLNLDPDFFSRDSEFNCNSTNFSQRIRQVCLYDFKRIFKVF